MTERIAAPVGRSARCLRLPVDGDHRAELMLRRAEPQVGVVG